MSPEFCGILPWCPGIHPRRAGKVCLNDVRTGLLYGGIDPEKYQVLKFLKARAVSTDLFRHFVIDVQDHLVLYFDHQKAMPYQFNSINRDRVLIFGVGFAVFGYAQVL